MSYSKNNHERKNQHFKHQIQTHLNPSKFEQSNRNHNQERSRSRNNFKPQENQKNFKQRSNRKFFDQNFKRNSAQYADSQKIIRQVCNVEIGDTKIYLLWKHPKAGEKQKPSEKPVTFNLNIIKSTKPPEKLQVQSSRLSELKNEITPVEQIWGQLIKQYLNDSEFVEIYRKRNSLSYGDVQYGKSIINYDGLDNNKKFYDNTETQYNIFSRAYFKLWEILNLGILNSKRQKEINIANLAQGPGGFIHSLIDYRLRQNKTLQDHYFAITLKIQQGKTRMAKDWSEYRGQNFFQKIKSEDYKVKLSYGQTGDGNLYDIRNIDSFKTHVMEGRQAFLVTGDGGIQCIGDDQFHYQQVFNSKLFFSQILTAFKIQQIGGAFILKIYDIHFQITNQLLMLLCIYYRKVGIIKPLTSRPGNSQKYVLCEGFFGISQLQLSHLSKLLREWHKVQNKLSYFQNEQYLHSILQFVSDKSSPYCDFENLIRKRINIINNQLSKEQQLKIQEGLNLIKRHNGSKQFIQKQIKQNRLEYQLGYAYKWCQRYGIKTIDVKVAQNKINKIQQKQ